MRNYQPFATERAALQDYPFPAPPSQLREPNRSAANDWLLEHAPWLWEKPRIRVYVSMKTGTVFWFEPARGAMQPVRVVDEAMHVGKGPLRFLSDRPANQFGVAVGQGS